MVILVLLGVPATLRAQYYSINIDLKTAAAMQAAYSAGAAGEAFYNEQLKSMALQIAKRPSSLKTTDVFKGFNWDKFIEHRKSSVRCKVEHAFLIVKRDFGYRKVAYKGLKKNQQILDHMGATELAANLFRITQTDDKLRRENIKGKELANETHFAVGKKVRQTIAELGGTMPEDLPNPKISAKKLKQERKKAVAEK